MSNAVSRALSSSRSAALVSVVIPCFNAASWISETLDSVSAQGWPNLEVIVVDDGSTDDTAGIVERNWPEAKVVRTANHGASAARNLGTRLAFGEFLQYLDADDLLAPGKIQAQARALLDSGADVAYGDFQRLEVVDGRFTSTGIISKTLGARPEIDLFVDFWLPPAAYLYRRRIVDTVGGWNVRLPIIQDARFALDCAMHGARFVKTPDVAALYRVHGQESLSRRDPMAFSRDVYENALEVEAWWTSHGGVDAARRAALVEVFGYVARSTYAREGRIFDAAVSALERLSPGYAPRRPFHMKVASRVLGYRRAEYVAARYRRAKRSLISVSQ